MKRAALIALLAAAGWAQAQVTLGRLFSSPEERAAMENARGGQVTPPPTGQAAQTVAGAPPGAPGGPQMVAGEPTGYTGGAGGVAGAPPGYTGGAGGVAGAPSGYTGGAGGVAGAPPGYTGGAGGVAGAPPGYTGGAGGVAGAPPGYAGGPGMVAGAPPGAPGGPPMQDPMAGAAGAMPSAASTLTMTGVLRSSDNQITVWLNGTPQPYLQGALTPPGAGPAALTLALPSGTKVILKPGQRYDLNERRVKDVNEP